MTRCAACGHETSDAARFCAQCGRPTAPGGATSELDVTRTTGGEALPSSLPSSLPSDGGRFVPGTLLAARYRVIALLGQGGMGEVIRADDLKLGQQVALKFLPPAVARDPGALARFHREVRVARQISHPNVCRVFDIGEADGQPFLTMEYIDGEDLASLLRRIGRLPEAKAIELARQLCAGLAAAHEAGILHRDLKPANVMIDGRGRARITDFGLAGIELEAAAAEIFAGTPAYMSPEQLAGKQVTRRSEIYSLGLVLSELFTGRRVFDAKTLPELRRQHEERAPETPSTLVRDLDPLIDAVIARCLSQDPMERPESALQVAAALPGGDPLQAALRAGETPSPEMVAAAPTRGALSPRLALSCLIAGILLLLAIIGGDSVSLIHRGPLDLPPDVLADRARGVLDLARGGPRPQYHARGIDLDDRYLSYEDPIPPPARWKRLAAGQPLGYYFWYREDVVPIIPSAIRNELFVTDVNPPLNQEGAARVRLDLRGRLIEFLRFPAAIDSTRFDSTRTVDWQPFCAAAGLNASELEPDSPRWTPPVFADQRAAWRGRFADHADLPLRVECAAWRGTPVYFRVVAPWDTPPAGHAQDLIRGEAVAVVGGMLLVLLVVGGAIRLIRHNLSEGRGDRTAAARLARVAAAVGGATPLLSARASVNLQSMSMLLYCTLTAAALAAGIVWMLYLALEPVVRRRRPELLVGWTRLLTGRWRDPMVGRDLLIGVTLGLAAAAGQTFAGWLKEWTGHPLPPNRFLDLRSLGGLSPLVSMLFDRLVAALASQLGVLLLLALATRWFRREKVAALAIWLVIVGLFYFAFARSWPVLSSTALMVALMVISVSRFGLLTGIVFQLCFSAVTTTIWTPHLGDWYARATMVMGGFFLLLLFLGFRLARGAGGDPRSRVEA